MTQAILRPNEFIIRVEEHDDEFIYHVRNPHVDAGQDNTYDLSALVTLAGFLKAAAKLRKKRTKPLNNRDESDTELYTG